MDEIYLEAAVRLEEFAKQIRTIWEEVCERFSVAAVAVKEALHKLHEALFGTKRAERYFFGSSRKCLKMQMMRPERDPPGCRSNSPYIPIRKHLPYQMRRYR